MKFKNIGLKPKMMLGSCVPSILVLVLGIISLMSIKMLLNTSHWVDHTHKAIQSAMKIEAAAVEMLCSGPLSGFRSFFVLYTDK